MAVASHIHMTDSSHSSEREIATQLVQRIKNGDHVAEAEMIARYSRGLRFLLRRRTRDGELSEDFLQETWAIALVKLRDGGIDQPGRLAGYLCGIANHLAAGETRRVKRQRTAVNSDIVELIPDDKSNPYRHTSRAEVCQQVRNLLNDLHKQRDREILERFYVREEDKDSICNDLDVDSQHFNRVLFRARQRLKAALEISYRRSHIRAVV